MGNLLKDSSDLKAAPTDSPPGSGVLHHCSRGEAQHASSTAVEDTLHFSIEDQSTYLGVVTVSDAQTFVYQLL